MATTSKKAAVGTAAIIALCVPFTAIREGTDLVAKRDPIGTGHPLTYCHGQTDEFGKVKAGQRFTPAQCDKLLAESLPTYLTPLQACIHVDAPASVVAMELDAAYNAGTAAVCRSPMVAKTNAGDFKGACEAFSGWYIRASGRVVPGLINRRNGEKQFCLEHLNDPKPAPTTPAPAPKPSWWTWLKSIFFH